MAACPSWQPHPGLQASAIQPRPPGTWPGQCCNLSLCNLSLCNLSLCNLSLCNLSLCNAGLVLAPRHRGQPWQHPRMTPALRPSVRSTLERLRPKPGGSWLTDEAPIRTRGQPHTFRRATDRDGQVPGIVAQDRRSATAAKRLCRKLPPSSGRTTSRPGG